MNLLDFNVSTLRRRLFSFKIFFCLAILSSLFRSAFISKIIIFDINAEVDIEVKIILGENIAIINYIFSTNVKTEIDKELKSSL